MEAWSGANRGCIQISPVDRAGSLLNGPFLGPFSLTCASGFITRLRSLSQRLHPSPNILPARTLLSPSPHFRDDLVFWFSALSPEKRPFFPRSLLGPSFVARSIVSSKSYSRDPCFCKESGQRNFLQLRGVLQKGGPEHWPPRSYRPLSKRAGTSKSGVSGLVEGLRMSCPSKSTPLYLQIRPWSLAICSLQLQYGKIIRARISLHIKGNLQNGGVAEAGVSTVRAPNPRSTRVPWGNPRPDATAWNPLVDILDMKSRNSFLWHVIFTKKSRILSFGQQQKKFKTASNNGNEADLVSSLAKSNTPGARPRS